MFPILLGKNKDLEKRVKTLEDSGGGGSTVNILNVNVTNGTLDKKYKEIKDADIAILHSKYEEDGEVLEYNAIFSYFGHESIGYVAGAFSCDNSGSIRNFYYIATTENDYPFEE